MSEITPFTIEGFYHFIQERKVMAAKCNKCGTCFLPPRPICSKCLSTDFKWVQLNRVGKLLTYTVIHVSPAQFQNMVPYIVGILELEDGHHLPGMIRGVEQEKMRIGMKLKVDFDTTTSSTWPPWPRYFFRLP